ncbi:hypothetical protein Anapl_11006 [Anas platyrhynchos]|uniref:Uncharacterized protein n=1 Tax=Anas platyrhynchos TaxID=8839 RepID=R0JER4_ANAPL|nr:hypothetical protein Anapl_11006 [Anas platyrhynchos]
MRTAGVVVLLALALCCCPGHAVKAFNTNRRDELHSCHTSTSFFFFPDTVALKEKPSDSQVAVPSRVLTPQQAPAQTGDSSLAIFPMAEAALKPHPEL